MASPIIDHAPDDSESSGYGGDFSSALAKTGYGFNDDNDDDNDDVAAGGAEYSDEDDDVPERSASSMLNNLFLTAPAPAKRSGAAVAAAPQEDSAIDPETKLGLLTARAKAKESHRRAEEALLNDENTIKVRLHVPFQWSGADFKGAEGLSSRTPPVFKVDEKSLDKIVAGKIDFRNHNVYVRSARIIETHSTAPYPLALSLKGIRGPDTLAVGHKTDGTPVTHVIHPGKHKVDEVVHKLSANDIKLILGHGNMRRAEEKRSITLMPGGKAFIDPNTGYGQWAKQHEKLYVSDLVPQDKSKGRLLPVNKYTPFYLTSAEQAQAGFRQFRKEVLDALPRTKFLNHTASLSRFDHIENDKDAKFGDASDAAGLSPAAISANNAARHSASVCIEYEFLNPTAVSAILATRAVR